MTTPLLFKLKVCCDVIVWIREREKNCWCSRSLHILLAIILWHLCNCTYMCHAQSNVRIKTMFDSFVCRRAHVLFVFACVYWCPNIYCVVFFFVLGDRCCQFGWIVYFWLALRYSLTFICNVSYTRLSAVRFDLASNCLWGRSFYYLYYACFALY